ncbi:MAG: protein O-GlcNAcase [Actinobacteria bacterium]|nr:protein O-GlcNAcase [Actinomycetota bacterium]
MSITLINSTPLQITMADAFAARHNASLHSYDISITIKLERLEKVEGFSLSARRDGNKVEATIGLTLEHSLRYGLNALRGWLATDKTECEVIDGPDFAIRGVVEGFYGKPWTHSQKMKGIEFFADYNMNTYFLAPKDDPLQRFNWRSPFTTEYLAQTKELIDLGKTHGIDFVLCVSPGLSVEYSSQSDVDCVVRRFKQLTELEATHFGMLWDDIAWEMQHDSDNARYASTAAAHADFTNRVWDQLIAHNEAAQLTVCPMHYSGRGNEPYVVDLGRELKSRINLMWTGRSICSEYLDIADAVIFERSALRPALYWDNFPVNDGGMQVNLNIGPVRGREKGLYKYSAGLLSNPMLQFEASQIPLSTIGEYLWNSESYNPEQAWERALTNLVSHEEDRSALRRFLRTSMGTTVGGDPAPDLRQVFRAGVSAWRTGDMSTASTVFKAEGDAILHNHTYLQSTAFSYPEIITEIQPWLVKYQAGGQTLIGLAEILLTCSYDSSLMIITGPADASKKLRALAENLDAIKKNLFGDQIVGPLNELAAELETYSV